MHGGTIYHRRLHRGQIPELLRGVAAGQPLFVTADTDYITLYHVFDGSEYAKKYALLRQKTDESRWRVIFVALSELAALRMQS